MFEKLTSSGRGALPSLNALRAFEAMARTGKATLAAEELGVSHSAVSRQVKALEHSLGVALFTGPKNRLELTAEGRALLPDLTAAFDRIAAATLKLRSVDRELHIAVNASTSIKWLIPRLSGFQATHPDLRVQLHDLAPQAMAHRGVHGLVRIVQNRLQRELAAVPFMANHIGPVIAPTLLDQGGDILSAPRLIAEVHRQGWSEWAALAGVEPPPAPVQTLSHLHFVLDGAVGGLGAAVLPWPLVADDVLAGRLVAPLGFQPAASAFCLIPTPGPTRKILEPFRAWLMDAGAAMSPPPKNQAFSPRTATTACDAGFPPSASA